MFRLDRFLISSSWGLSLQTLSQWCLPKSLSDHNPVVLTDSSHNWGPIPFKFFNFWLEDPVINREINRSLLSSGNQSSPGSCLVDKLELSKHRIQQALRQSKSSLVSNPKILELQINKLEIEQEAQPFSEERVTTKLKLQAKIWQAYRLQESKISQKSRVQWLQLGDKNTKFFHIVAANRKRKNSIYRISNAAGELSNPQAIKGAILQHFIDRFNPQHLSRALFNSDGFQTLNAMQRDMLEKPFSLGEVEFALSSCDGNKSPGIDGFTMLHTV